MIHALLLIRPRKNLFTVLKLKAVFIKKYYIIPYWTVKSKKLKVKSLNFTLNRVVMKT